MVQVPPLAIEMNEIEKLDEVNVAVGVPQLDSVVCTTAIVSPEGRLSVKLTPVSAVALGLVSMNVKDVLPFSAIVDAPKAFEIVGGAITVRLAVAVLPVPPLVEVT